jgi:hypothetical protein
MPKKGEGTGEEPPGTGDGKKPEGTNGNGAGSPAPAAGKTFTQAEFDALAEKERKRGIDKGAADLITGLGLESADELKAKLAELAKLEESKLTEAEKQQATIDAMTKQIEEEKAAGLKAIDEANARLMRAAVMTEAAKTDLNVHEEARADVWAFVDRAELTVTDAGEVEGVEAAVKVVIEARPYLVSNQTSAAPGGTPRRESKKNLSDPKPKEPDIAVVVAQVGAIWPLKAEIFSMVAAEAVTAGAPIHRDTAGKAALADANAAGEQQCRGICLGGSS